MYTHWTKSFLRESNLDWWVYGAPCALSSCLVGGGEQGCMVCSLCGGWGGAGRGEQGCMGLSVPLAPVSGPGENRGVWCALCALSSCLKEERTGQERVPLVVTGPSGHKVTNYSLAFSSVVSSFRHALQRNFHREGSKARKEKTTGHQLEVP